MVGWRKRRGGVLYKCGLDLNELCEWVSTVCVKTGEAQGDTQEEPTVEGGF